MLLALVCLAAQPGCLTTRVKWQAPRSSVIDHLACPGAEADLTLAESLFQQAAECEQACDETCVDLYFASAVLTSDYDAGEPYQSPACTLHHAALVKLVTAAQDFGRLDPRRHLIVHWRGHPERIPVHHVGFCWEADDFERVEPIGDYRTNAFRQSFREAGFGVPLVATCSGPRGRPFLASQPTFAATLMMCAPPAAAQRIATQAQHVGGITLNLYDPQTIDYVPHRSKLIPLAKDLSAPLAYRLRHARRRTLRNFIQPESIEGESQLYMLEPFQPDKQPIVFIHGLLSDPFTWAEMVNELQSQPSFRHQNQIWVFEYPTGQAILESAAALRQHLASCSDIYGHCTGDGALSNVVLVGHSLGGLVAKLQITASGQTLWRSIADKPFEAVVMSPDMREQLHREFFFEPSPSVSRVVFIGTPHQGSVYARRLVGRLGSALVAPTRQRQWEHEQLVSNNPGVFSEEVQRRIPTSIDLLEPDSPLLEAISALPVSSRVQLHSIIGEGRWTLGFGPSDGVVPIESAQEPRAESERYIREVHGRLNKHPEAVDELLRILAEP